MDNGKACDLARQPQTKPNSDRRMWPYSKIIASIKANGISVGSK
jgi:hypothetical protein